MTAAILMGLACIISYFAIRFKNMMFGFVASAVWLAVIIYTRTYPIGDMVTGDNADSTILTALIGAMIVVPISV